MAGTLPWRRAGCALVAAAVALVFGPARAAAQPDGAELFVLPPDLLLIQQAPYREQARREPSRGLEGQLWAIGAWAERVRETSVTPRFWGFHGFGVMVRGNL
jgi:hypothetical protein